MSELQQAAGVGPAVTWKGKTYRVSPYSWKLRALFQEWVEDAGFRKVERLRGKVDPVAYRERLEAVAALVVGKSFEAGNPAFLEAAKSLEGQAYEAYLRIHFEADGRTAKHPDFTFEEAVKMQASEAWDELAVKMQVMDTDPNAPGTAPKEASPSPGGR